MPTLKIVPHLPDQPETVTAVYAAAERKFQELKNLYTKGKITIAKYRLLIAPVNKILATAAMQLIKK